MFGLTGDWSTATLDPGVLNSTVCKGSCRFMTEWEREEEKMSENRLRKRDRQKRRTGLRLHLG